MAAVDEDTLSGIDLTQWNDTTKKAVKAAAREALKKFDGGIVVDGITRKVNKVTRKEYTGSNYSEKIAKNFLHYTQTKCGLPVHWVILY